MQFLTSPVIEQSLFAIRNDTVLASTHLLVSIREFDKPVRTASPQHVIRDTYLSSSCIIRLGITISTFANAKLVQLANRNTEETLLYLANFASIFVLNIISGDKKSCREIIII